MDGALARAAADCVTSVVLGKDWVPRLSLASFERLRDEMVPPCTLLPAFLAAFHMSLSGLHAGMQEKDFARQLHYFVEAVLACQC